MDLQYLDGVGFSPDFQSFSREIRLDAYPELEDEVRAVFRRAVSLARPKAVYRRCNVNQLDAPRVVIDGQVFTSSALAENLENEESVVAYIATCGREIHEIDLDGFDPLASYWLSVLKERALRAVSALLFDTVEATYRIDSLSTMNPGSANVDVWPIDQQPALFSLLGDTESTVGVTLTENHLMVPDKTISGVFFHSASGYIACHACDRENCLNRRAPFQGRPSGLGV